MKTSKILKAINEMSENQLIDLNNRYAQSINASDNEVYNNDDDFFETWGAKATEVLRAAHFGDYNWSHNYVKFNGYGNLESFDYFEVKDLCELPEVMAKYIHENFNEFEDLF